MARQDIIRIEGLEGLERQVKVLSPKGQRRVWRNVFRAAGRAVIQKEAGAELRRQGHRGLAKQLRTTATATAANITARIAAKAKTKLQYIGHLLEFGTRPHGISPKRKKVLRLGEGLFRAAVQHPGAKAKPWFLPVLARRRSQVADDIARRIGAEVQKARARGL